jgi:hypothetical protein
MKRLLALLAFFAIAFSAAAQTSQGAQFQRTYAKSLDYYFGKTASGISVPWASVTEANNTIPITRRYDGMFIMIGADSAHSQIYWYHGGRGNANLQPFNSSVSPTEQILTDTTTIAWDYANGAYARVTLGGNRTLAPPTNATAPCSGVLVVIQDATGGRTLSLPGNVTAGYSLSSNPGDIDIIGFNKTSSGLFWDFSNYGTVSGLTPLSTPTLTATVISSTQIDLSWTNVANESSYKLEWSPNGTSSWTQIGGTIAANTTTYSHTSLTASTHYYYRVSAIGDGVTYSNSGYGTDDDVTSSGGGGTLSNITFVTDGLTPSGGVFTVNDGVFTVSHKADQTLTADGYIQFDVASRDCILGFKTAVAGGGFATFDVGAWINASAGQLNAMDGGAATTSPAPLGVAPAGGSTQIRITRTGSTLTVQAYNAGTPVGSSYTLGFTSSASPLYVYATFSTGHLDNPKIFQ